MQTKGNRAILIGEEFVKRVINSLMNMNVNIIACKVHIVEVYYHETNITSTISLHSHEYLFVEIHKML